MSSSSAPKERSQKPGTIDTPPSIETLSSTTWKQPTLPLPLPSLQFLFHLECDMESFRPIGPGPHGTRATVIFKGGRFEGPRLRGTILSGGGDWEIVRDHAPHPTSASPHNDEPQQTAHLDTRYNLLTQDGATIYLQTTGTRTGAKRILEKLGEGDVGADEYRMRLHLTMETGDERYSWVNEGVFVASSARSGDMVVYDAYQLL